MDGVVGVYGQDDNELVSKTFLATGACQHRGKASTGLAVGNAKGIYIHKGLGRIAEVIDHNIMMSEHANKASNLLANPDMMTLSYYNYNRSMLNKDISHVYYKISKIYLLRDLLDKSVETAEKSLEFNDNNRDLYIHLLNLYKKTQQTEKFQKISKEYNDKFF